jgi:phosphoribosyl-ATP pyrophosphohydrolase
MNIYEKAIAKFGIEHQKKKVIEELSELIRAISRGDRANVIEEMADVTIMMKQLDEIYKIRYDEWEDILEKKEEKLEQLLSENKVCGVDGCSLNLEEVGE